MIGRFNKIFGITDDLTAEQSRFVQRINQTAFRRIEDREYEYQAIFEALCYCLGINGQDRIARANSNNYGSSLVVPHLRSLTEDDFTETLKVSALLYQILEREPKKELDQSIETALSHAAIDIGVRWKDGMFYPAGAKELDERLIEEPLQWLINFPNERADYLKALTGYAAKRSDDVIMNCYLVIEGVARSVLANQKTLENNRENLLRTIGLSQEWKALLSNFITYANEFKRHASGKRYDVNPVEVEGFLYLTGLLVRLIAEATKRPAPELAREES
jgi:hypothetical protein